MPTRMIWVHRSPMARIRLSREDSSVPLTFSAARIATTTMPPKMSPGPWPSAGQKTLR